VGLTRVHTEVAMGTATRLLVFVTATAVLVGSPVARAAGRVKAMDLQDNVEPRGGWACYP
jgi:hypothetical protein